MREWFIISTFFLSLCGHALEPLGGKTGYFREKDQGYFFYDDPLPVKSEPKIEPVRKPKASTTAGPIPFSSEWVKAQLPKQLMKALDSHHPRDVAGYQYLQRLAIDKSHNFSNLTRQIYATDPLLQEDIRSGSNLAVKHQLIKLAKNEKQSLFDNIRDSVGLFYFVRTDCEYCKAQTPALLSLQRTTGLTLNVVVLDAINTDIQQQFPNQRVRQDSGQFESLGLKLVPSVVLVKPPSDFGILSEGYFTASELETRLIEHLSQLNLVPDSIKSLINPLSRGVIDPEKLRAMNQVDGNDINSWLPHLRRLLGADPDAQAAIYRPDYYQDQTNEEQTP